MFDSACEEGKEKKRRKLYERAYKFQDVSIIRVPWVESILDEKGHVQQVWCKICTFVQRKDNLLVPKLDSLLKHQNHWKAKFSMSGVDARNEAQR